MDDPEAQYLYYCLYQDGSRLRTIHSYGSIEEDRKGGIGRLDTNLLPPPRNIKGLKRYIARLERFSATEVEAIFLTSESSESEDDSTRLDISANAPGRDSGEPIHAIIFDGAVRPPSGDPSRSTGSVGSHSGAVLPAAAPNLLIHKNAIWKVDSTGFAEPICQPGNSSQIVGPKEPPGWAPAHVKTDPGNAIDFRPAEGAENIT
ncbi:hypothetical protein DL93DRAFT_1107581 [Clavulina sp. PMI_390]|nr:hypothetical protein DL93DRAFT_1107581 [Clavulina sp. PMI_390]